MRELFKFLLIAMESSKIELMSVILELTALLYFATLNMFLKKMTFYPLCVISFLFSPLQRDTNAGYVVISFLSPQGFEQHQAYSRSFTSIKMKLSETSSNL